MKPYKCSKTGEQRSGSSRAKSTIGWRSSFARPTLSDRRKPQVDIETFVSGLDVDLDQYAPLPETVLGETRFEPGKRPKSSDQQSANYGRRR